MRRRHPAYRGASAASRVGAVFVSLCAVGGALWPVSGQAQVFASIPVEASAVAAPPASGSAVRVRVQAADAAALARFLGRPEGEDTRQGHVVLTLAPGRQADLDVALDALAASFIIDHADPAVQQLKAQLLQQRPGEPVDGARVVAFVASVMRSEPAQTPYASAVARNLRGDCTEHALLSAALARALGIPARVVHGAVLVAVNGQWQGYGHAWIQTQESGQWVLRDSALWSEPGPIYYLPSLVLSNEGPGHRLSLLQGLARLPSRIEVLGLAQDPGGR